VLADFGDVREIADFDCPHCMRRMRELRIFLARNPRAPIPELWPGWRDYR
jgi:hypothetical protein